MPNSIVGNVAIKDRDEKENNQWMDDARTTAGRRGGRWTPMTELQRTEKEIAMKMAERRAEFAELAKGLSASQCTQIANQCNQSCNWTGSTKGAVAEWWVMGFSGGGKFDRVNMRRLLHNAPRKKRKTATDKRAEAREYSRVRDGDRAMYAAQASINLEADEQYRSERHEDLCKCSDDALARAGRELILRMASAQRKLLYASEAIDEQVRALGIVLKLQKERRLSLATLKGLCDCNGSCCQRGSERSSSNDCNTS